MSDTEAPLAELIDTVRQWVQKAEEDFRAAERLLETDDPWLYRPTSFHAQQCAEKYLKALLVMRNQEVPKTHDLERLLTIVATMGTPPTDLPPQVMTASLNRYAVGARYPDDIEPVTAEEAQDAVATAGTIRDTIRRILPAGVLT